MRGRIVIGEGERDEAPMLYIGEELGGAHFPEDARAEFPEVDIAVDPLEGTNLCALGANNAIFAVGRGISPACGSFASRSSTDGTHPHPDKSGSMTSSRTKLGGFSRMRARARRDRAKPSPR